MRVTFVLLRLGGWTDNSIFQEHVMHTFVLFVCMFSSPPERQKQGLSIQRDYAGSLCGREEGAQMGRSVS